MWAVARTIGRESRACLYLRRAGIRAFRPVEHRYYIDKRSKEERYRERSRFVGYVFVEINSDDERDAARNAIGIAGLLGWWTPTGFQLARIPDHYVTDLMDGGPIIIGKQTRNGFKFGQKVKLAASAVAEILATFEGVDKSGKAVIKAELLGGVRKIHVELERLEAAE